MYQKRIIAFQKYYTDCISITFHDVRTSAITTLKYFNLTFWWNHTHQIKSWDVESSRWKLHVNLFEYGLFYTHTHFCIYMNILVLHQILKLFLKGPDGFGLLLLEEFLFRLNELAYQTLDWFSAEILSTTTCRLSSLMLPKSALMSSVGKYLN